MDALTGLAVVAALATAAVLVAGIASMMHGGEFDERHGGQLMVARVGLQALAFALLLAAMGLALLRG